MAALQTLRYDRTVEALQLNGKGERTQQAYTRAVRLLIEFHGKKPDQISEDRLKAYIFCTAKTSPAGPHTLRISCCGIKFFYQHVVKRDWHTLNILKAQSERRLPCVLIRQEIDRIFKKVTTFHNFAFLSTIYSCGLRLQEGLFLQIADIDARRQ